MEEIIKKLTLMLVYAKSSARKIIRYTRSSNLKEETKVLVKYRLQRGNVKSFMVAATFKLRR